MVTAVVPTARRTRGVLLEPQLTAVQVATVATDGAPVHETSHRLLTKAANSCKTVALLAPRHVLCKLLAALRT